MICEVLPPVSMVWLTLTFCVWVRRTFQILRPGTTTTLRPLTVATWWFKPLVSGGPLLHRHAVVPVLVDRVLVVRGPLRVQRQRLLVYVSPADASLPAAMLDAPSDAPIAPTFELSHRFAVRAKGLQEGLRRRPCVFVSAIEDRVAIEADEAFVFCWCRAFPVNHAIGTGRWSGSKICKAASTGSSSVSLHPHILQTRPSVMTTMQQILMPDASPEDEADLLLAQRGAAGKFGSTPLVKPDMMQKRDGNLAGANALDGPAPGTA